MAVPFNARRDVRVPAAEPYFSSKKPMISRVRSFTAITLPKSLPILIQMGEILGGSHAKSSDCIRAAEDRHPDHRILRCRRVFAQRLGFLGPPAGHQPHRGGRRHLGEPFQGDAQSAHRSVHDQPAVECRSADGRRHRKIPARPARRRNARDGQRAWDASHHRVRRAEDAGAGVRSPVQDVDRAAEGILGRSPQAEGLAPRGAGQGIYGNDAGLA